MRVVIKSRIRRKRKATAEQNSPPNPQAEQSEVSSYDRLKKIAELYEPLREKLILYFKKRGCHDAVELADITLMRVLKKAYADVEIGDLTAYTFGFAGKIFLEYLRRKKTILADIDELKHKLAAAPSYENDADIRERKLARYEECLAELEKEDREMLFAYYQYRGQRKLEHRRKMAEQMDITRDALTIRIYRLKQQLRERYQELLNNK